MFEVIENLAALRKAAGVSQEEMAQHLGVSQSQISRYEQNPDDLPVRMVKKWASRCGIVVPGEEATPSPGLSVGQPYQDIQSRLRLIQDYAEAEPAVSHPEAFPNAPSGVNFVARVKLEGRKPRVGIFGYFDQGKSRLLNALMNSNALPVSWQPATSLICLIRHIDDRPSFIREDVWIMGRDKEGKPFDLNNIEDEQYYSTCRLYAGGYEALRRYGTHGGPGVSDECQAALVFVRSDLLHACDLIDSPGFGNTEKDSEKAQFARPLADIMIYASGARGFMQDKDFIALSGLLKQLPVVGNDDGLAPLDNLYVVATNADMPSHEREDILNVASKRVFVHLKDNLLQPRQGQEVTYEQFRSRFFTFRAEDPVCRKQFQDDLARKLGATYPYLIRTRLDKSVVNLKSGAKRFWQGWEEQLVEALTKKNDARVRLNDCMLNEDARLSTLRRKRKAILSKISQNKQESRELIQGKIAQALSEGGVKDVILKQYNEKGEAQSLAGTYISETCQNGLSKFLTIRAEALASEINDVLNDFVEAGQAVGGVPIGSVTIPFNAQGVFMGALAGVASTGALAVWAAIATAGSNLGVYLLVPSVVTFLSSLGIGVGGTASAISFVAAIGGPLTIMIAAGVLVAILGVGLFGPSWQTRLARKLSEIFKDKKFIETLIAHADMFWSNTQESFEEAIKETEEKFLEYVKSLESLMNATSREQLELRAKEVDEIRDFFAGIPWRPAK